jgi:hypothetical protein
VSPAIRQRAVRRAHWCFESPDRRIVRRLKPVDFGGKNEVALRQTVDFVRPDRQPDPAPGQVDIRVVSLLFRKFTDTIRKIESLAEIFKLVFPLQVVFFDETPAVFDPSLQAFEALTLERRNAACARDARLVCQIGCHGAGFPIFGRQNNGWTENGRAGTGLSG